MEGEGRSIPLHAWRERGRSSAQPTSIAPPAAPVLLAKVEESMRTREESMDSAPALPPAFMLKLLRRIWIVELRMRTMPGTAAHHTCSSLAISLQTRRKNPCHSCAEVQPCRVQRPMQIQTAICLAGRKKVHLQRHGHALAPKIAESTKATLCTFSSSRTAPPSAVAGMTVTPLKLLEKLRMHQRFENHFPCCFINLQHTILTLAQVAMHTHACRPARTTCQLILYVRMLRKGHHQAMSGDSAMVTGVKGPVHAMLPAAIPVPSALPCAMKRQAVWYEDCSSMTVPLKRTFCSECMHGNKKSIIVTSAQEQ